MFLSTDVPLIYTFLAPGAGIISTKSTASLQLEWNPVLNTLIPALGYSKLYTDIPLFLPKNPVLLALIEHTLIDHNACNLLRLALFTSRAAAWSSGTKVNGVGGGGGVK